MIKKLKLLFVTLFSVGSLGFMFMPAVSAADFNLFGKECVGDPGAQVCGPCKNKPDALVCDEADNRGNPIWGSGSIVEVLVGIISLIIGVAAVIVIIIAGIQYMLSTGDPTKVNNAKNAILYAVIGLVVAILARFVIPFVLGRL